MRYLIVALWMLSCPLTSAVAQISIAIGSPNVSIGINVPVYPQLVPVPGYPVYYAPGMSSNYFFYDGMYWVYEQDNWYASSWYNGPWALVAPDSVPVFILRVPVRYYRQPPPHFRGWRRDAPPRWGDRWGNDWEGRHRGWERWDRRAAPRPAPLPVYQRQYSGNRYPHPEQQQALHGQNYRYQPRDASVRQAYEAHGLRGGPPPSQRGSRGEPPHGGPPPSQRGSRGEPPQGGPPPSQRGSRGEPPAGSMQRPDAQRPNPPSPHAEPGRTTPRGQPARAPEQDRGHQGRGGAGEPRGNPGQQRGEERDRGPERGR